MLKSELLRAIRQEIQRHDFSHFIDVPPMVAQGGKGIVVRGCPVCKKRINTTSQFLDHLTNDAMPALIDRLAAAINRSEKQIADETDISKRHVQRIIENLEAKGKTEDRPGILEVKRIETTGKQSRGPNRAYRYAIRRNAACFRNTETQA